MHEHMASPPVSFMPRAKLSASDAQLQLKPVAEAAAWRNSTLRADGLACAVCRVHDGTSSGRRPWKHGNTMCYANGMSLSEAFQEVFKSSHLHTQSVKAVPRPRTLCLAMRREAMQG